MALMLVLLLYELGSFGGAPAVHTLAVDTTRHDTRTQIECVFVFFCFLCPRWGAGGS